MPLNRRDLLSASQALVASGLLAGCTGTAPAPETEPGATDATTEPPSSTADRTTDETTETGSTGAVEQLVRGNTQFALDLLGRLSETSDGANLFFSPYSVSVALAMTYAGARGETRSAMRETLQFPPDDAVNSGFRQLRQRFAAYDAAESTTGEADATRTTTDERRRAMPFRLSSANALWGQEGFPFADAYLRTLERNYGAGLKTLDFESNPERARRTINQWVADRTAGKITDLLPPGIVTAMTRLVLTNAVYFRANWAKQFDPDDTGEGTFTALDGTERTVSMMSQTETFRYASVEGHQLVELPYEGEDVGMVVVLPAAGEFERFQRSLDATRLAGLVERMESRKGTISLPRFEYRSNFRLRKQLSALGMSAAFGSGADFSGMVRGDAGGGLSIDDVVHESYVGVDEHGTEAAAATAVVMETAAQTTTAAPFEMTVDRPFLFLIRDRATGTVLFLGRVADAAAARPAES